MWVTGNGGEGYILHQVAGTYTFIKWWHSQRVFEFDQCADARVEHLDESRHVLCERDRPTREERILCTFYSLPLDGGCATNTITAQTQTHAHTQATNEWKITWNEKQQQRERNWTNCKWFGWLSVILSISFYNNKKIKSKERRKKRFFPSSVVGIPAIKWCCVNVCRMCALLGIWSHSLHLSVAHVDSIKLFQMNRYRPKTPPPPLLPPPPLTIQHSIRAN